MVRMYGIEIKPTKPSRANNTAQIPDDQVLMAKLHSLIITYNDNGQGSKLTWSKSCSDVINESRSINQSPADIRIISNCPRSWKFPCKKTYKCPRVLVIEYDISCTSRLHFESVLAHQIKRFTLPSRLFLSHLKRKQYSETIYTIPALEKNLQSSDKSKQVK